MRLNSPSGDLKVNAEYHSSSCYVPSSLQLLKPEKVDVKSYGERMPIVAMLSKDASAKGYDTLLYVNDQLLESSRDSLGFIIRSFGDPDASGHPIRSSWTRSWAWTRIRK